MYSNTKMFFMTLRTLLFGVAFCVLLLLPTLLLASDAVVSSEAINTLIIGENDLPPDLMLANYTSSLYYMPLRTELDACSAGFAERWLSPLSGRSGTIPTAHHSVEITICLFDSSNEALKYTRKVAMNNAIVPPEISGQPLINQFADYAWCQGNATQLDKDRSIVMTFVRSNVFVLLHVTNKDGVDQDMFYALATRIGDKIDMARTGRPYPPTVLPPSVKDMKIGIEDAWNLRRVAKAQGKTTNVALKIGKSTPRTLISRKIASGNYLVPLSYLAGIMGTESKPKISGQSVFANIAGRNVVFTKGSSKVKVDGKTVDIGARVELRNNQAFVPLSFLEKGLGKRIAWGKTGKGGKMLMAKVQ